MKAGATLKVLFFVGAGLVLIYSAVARANAVPGTVNIINVQATFGGHTAMFQEVFPVTNFDGELSWSLPAPIVLEDGSYSMGVLESLRVTFNADPEVNLDFALRNSSLTDAVMFNISTATIVFDPVPNAEAVALASVTLTQGSGSPLGASITGLLDGSIYQARYSTHNVNNTKTVFAGLVPGFSFEGFGSQNMTDYLPVSGMSALNTTVHMMESEFKFILSPGDQASGTSIFVITPEPGSLALMGIAAGLLLGRRRFN